MSRRHPPSTTSTASNGNVRTMRIVLTGYLGNRSRMQALQKSARVCRVVLRIGSKHDQEETIFAGECETRHVEYRVIRHGQPVQREHSEYRREATEQDGHFKCHDDERRPGVIGLSTNVDGIADRRDPVL